jgi:hypothetical protein
MEADKLADPTLWRTLADIFGPGGIVLLLTNAASWYTAYLMWQRLKEKDAECRQEIATMSALFAESRNQLRADIKEAFASVAKLAEQVTVLATKASFKI